MSDADMELDSSVRALEALSTVVEAMTPAEVELVTLCMEVVCKLSASVAFRLGEILVPTPVGITDRLKVIPSSAELVLVLLRPPGRPVVAAIEDCIGVDRVEFAPGPSSEDDASDSLAGTRIPDVAEDIPNDVVSEVWIAVWFTAAPVTELSKENATVLKSITLDLALEIYTVENVAVTVPDAMGALGLIWVLPGITDDIKDVPFRLVGINAPVEAKEETPGSVGVAIEVGTREDMPDTEPVDSEAGIGPFEEVLDSGDGTEVGFTDGTIWLPLISELKLDSSGVAVDVNDCSGRLDCVLDGVDTGEDKKSEFPVDVDDMETTGSCTLVAGVSEGIKEKDEVLSEGRLDERPVPIDPRGVDCWTVVAELSLSMIVGVGVRIKVEPKEGIPTDWLDRKLAKEELGSLVSLGDGPVWPETMLLEGSNTGVVVDAMGGAVGPRLIMELDSPGAVAKLETTSKEELLGSCSLAGILAGIVDSSVELPEINPVEERTGGAVGFRTMLLTCEGSAITLLEILSVLANDVWITDVAGVDTGSTMLDERIGVSNTLDTSARADEDATDGRGVCKLLTASVVVDEIGSCGSWKELDWPISDDGVGVGVEIGAGVGSAGGGVADSCGRLVEASGTLEESDSKWLVLDSKTLEGLGGVLEEVIGCGSTGIEVIGSVVETSGVLVITMSDAVADNCDVRIDVVEDADSIAELGTGTLGSVCEVSAGGGDAELDTEDDVGSGEGTISDVGTGVGTGVGSLTGPVLDGVSRMIEDEISTIDELVEDATGVVEEVTTSDVSLLDGTGNGVGTSGVCWLVAELCNTVLLVLICSDADEIPPSLLLGSIGVELDSVVDEMGSTVVLDVGPGIIIIGGVVITSEVWGILCVSTILDVVVVALETGIAVLVRFPKASWRCCNEGEGKTSLSTICCDLETKASMMNVSSLIRTRAISSCFSVLPWWTDAVTMVNANETAEQPSKTFLNHIAWSQVGNKGFDELAAKWPCNPKDRTTGCTALHTYELCISSANTDGVLLVVGRVGPI
jgi:hypothetical protein